MKAFVWILLSYAVGWLFAYVFVMGTDFRYVGEYLILGWTGGLEKPGGINLLALAFTLVAGVIRIVVWWIDRRKKTKSKKSRRRKGR